MNIAPPSFKSIAASSIVVFGGYFICSFLVLLLAVLRAPFWVLDFFICLQLSVAAASGFVGALYARTNPVINGTLGGAIGAGILLSVLAALAPGTGEFSYYWSFGAAISLAFIGALVAVFAWPRHGL